MAPTPGRTAGGWGDDIEIDDDGGNDPITNEPLPSALATTTTGTVLLHYRRPPEEPHAPVQGKAPVHRGSDRRRAQPAPNSDARHPRHRPTLKGVGVMVSRWLVLEEVSRTSRHPYWFNLAVPFCAIKKGDVPVLG